MSDTELIDCFSAAVAKHIKLDTICGIARTAPEGTAPEGYLMRWVRLKRYAEITGDTVDAVMGRRKLGKWLDGNECKLVDGKLWINLQAVERWIEQWGTGPAKVAVPAPPRVRVRVRKNVG